MKLIHYNLFLITFILFEIFGKISSLEIITILNSNDETDSNSDTEVWNKPYSLSDLKVLEPSVDIHVCTFFRIAECLSLFKNTSILLDLSSELDIQISLSQLCKDHMLIHLVDQNQMNYIDKQTFSFLPSKRGQMAALFSLLRYFNWTEGMVFGQNINYVLKSEIFHFSEALKFSEIESSTNIKELVDRIAFRLGATLYYILTDYPESVNLQNSLQRANLLSAGTGLILDQKSGYNCTTEGALIVTEFGHEFDKSPEEYLENSIFDIISYLLKTTSSETLIELEYFLDLFLLNHSNKNEYSIINIQNGKRVIVGSIINSNVIIFENIIFPGNTNAIPKAFKKVLPLSISDGITNPGFASNGIQKLFSMASWIAIDEINEGNGILSNFQISLFSYDCGVTIFNEAFATACYKKDIDKIGLAHLTAFGSSVTIGTLQIFKKLNFTVACIGSLNSDPSLSSSQIYPMYVRVVSSSLYSQLMTLIGVMGWKKAAVVYENNGWSIPAYSVIVEMSKRLEIELINPENLRALPPGLNSTSIKDHTDVFQALIDSQARLLIVLCQNPTSVYILEYLYDLGIRKGDLTIIAGTSDAFSYFLVNDTNLYKRFEVAYSAIQMLYKIWVGDIGKDTKNRISLKYHVEPAGASCFYYDSIYLVANALDYMINRGLNYTDPEKLMKAIRNTKFIGCTGSVSLDNGSNDRIFDTILIQAIKADQDGKPIVYDFGELKPLSTQLLSVIETYIYADGTANKPSDLRNANYVCPFPNRDIQTFAKGRAVLFAISFVISLTTVIITFTIWKKWWNIQIETLKAKQEISFQDTVVGLTIAIEFFQFLAMGPDISLISTLLGDVCDLSSLNLGNIFKLRNGLFWIVVDVVYGGIALWVIFCAVILFRLDEKLQFIGIFKLLGSAEDYLMPVLGNLCFIPFISICLDVFVCDQSIGDSFTDSFLASDCFCFCWKDKHLIYAVFAFLALIAYEPLAVFCRPLWQELQPTLHVKSSPLYLMGKTIIQTILVVLNKTVKRASNLGHGIIFIAIIAIYISFSLKFKPYNYDRFSLWQCLSLIGVVWIALLSTIRLLIQYGDFSMILIFILTFGLILIASFGFYVQHKKYPSMLYRSKAINTSTLFKFAFTFGKVSKNTLDQFKLNPKESRILQLN